MKLPDDVRQVLRRRFDNRHREWLVSATATDEWPMEIALGVPSEQSAFAHLDATRAWVEAWQKWGGEGSLQWVERRWRLLGTQRVPASLRLDSPRQVAGWLSETARWDRASARQAALVERWPILSTRLGGLFDMLADYSDADFDRLLSVLAWLETHRHSGLYLRQLPIPGLDTKWIEVRKPVLSELLCLITGRENTAIDFHTLCGLRRLPIQLRMRVLDPALRARLAGIGDLTAPLDDLARLEMPRVNVIIVENLQTGLALGDLHNTVAFMGLGYGVDLLSRLPWLNGARCVYWGDLDTHGFAILSRARAYFPALRTVLMDETTLRAYRALWTTEVSQHAAPSLPGLLPDEDTLYRALKTHAFGHAVRLEQERLGWDHAWMALVREVAGLDGSEASTCGVDPARQE